MRRLISFLLLASAAAAPLAAQDRDAPFPRGDRGERGQRGDERGGFRPGADQAGPGAQDRIGQGQIDQRRGEGPGGGWRDGRNDDRPDPRGGGNREGYAGGRDRGADDRGDRFRDGRDGRFDNRAGNGRPGDYRGNDYAGRSGDWRDDRGRPNGGYDNRYGNGRYGDNGYRNGRYGNGAQLGWSGQWRNDRRYDWQGYRSANRNLFRAPRYYGPRGYDYSRWSRGYRVQPFFYGQNYWISDPWRYRLPPADGYYRWVRYYDDVALIDVRSGLIEDIIYSFFYR